MSIWHILIANCNGFTVMCLLDILIAHIYSARQVWYLQYKGGIVQSSKVASWSTGASLWPDKRFNLPLVSAGVWVLFCHFFVATFFWLLCTFAAYDIFQAYFSMYFYDYFISIRHHLMMADDEFWCLRICAKVWFWLTLFIFLLLVLDEIISQIYSLIKWRQFCFLFCFNEMIILDAA